MAHEAPTTKEDTILESLKQLSEIELQDVLSNLATYLRKQNQEHVYEQAFGVSFEEIENLEDQIDDLKSEITMVSTTNERLNMNLIVVKTALEGIREMPFTEGIDEVIKMIK